MGLVGILILVQYVERVEEDIASFKNHTSQPDSIQTHTSNCNDLAYWLQLSHFGNMDPFSSLFSPLVLA